MRVRHGRGIYRFHAGPPHTQPTQPCCPTASGSVSSDRVQRVLPVGLLVVVAIIAPPIAPLIGLLPPAARRAQRTVKCLQDSASLSRIHNDFLTWANEDEKGRIPIPRHLASILHSADGQGASVPHASISSTPCAQSVLHRERKKFFWSNNAVGTRAVLANRGTFKGLFTGASYAKCYALTFHAPDDTWEGNICYGDIHGSLERSMVPDNVQYECGNINLKKDNIYAWSDFASCNQGASSGGDTWMCIGIGAPNISTYTEAPENLTDGTSP